VQTAKDIPTIIAYVDTEMRGQASSGVGNVSASDRMSALAEAGVRLMPVESDGRGHVSLSDLLKKLGADGIDSILVEGGSALHGSFMDNRLINRVYAYISPRLFGGEASLSPVGGIGITDSDEALRLADVEMLQLGEDLCITGKAVW
jgi:diaminohydroxyphosphoribosylaminopyrimidine deaminase/5-amino-6-(5-phosphoribosylamino)uracil reductase